MSARSLLLLLALSSVLGTSLAEYVVQANGTSCLILNIDAVIEVKYMDTKGIGKSVYVQIPNDIADYTGDCIPQGVGDSPTARLRAKLPDGSTINVTFVQVEFEEKGESVSMTTLNSISYEYDTTKNKDFIDPAFKGVTRAAATDLLIKMHHPDHYYLCRRDMKVALYPTAEITLRYIKAEAIDIRNNSYSPNAEECPENPPETTTTTLPTTTSQAYGDKYYVMDKETGNVCLVLQFNATFKIPYLTLAGNKDTATVPFNPLGVVQFGNCGEEKQNLTLQWKPVTSYLDPLAQPWFLTFGFSRVESESENADDYVLSRIALNYELDNFTFPNTANESTRVISVSDSDERFKTPVGKVYRCNSDRDIKLTDDGFSIDTSNFKAEAFRKDSKTPSFDSEEVICTEDKPPTPPSTTSVVLIVVGVILAILLIIGIAVFFYVRHRQRQNYQQLA